MFVENFKQFEDGVSDDAIKAAAPKVHSQAVLSILSLNKKEATD
jgi:hypothetical protein